MIKPDKIGTTYTVRYNMLDHVVTISNDPANFEYYKTLGLDVFEEVVVEYKPKRRRRTKKQIKEEE